MSFLFEVVKILVLLILGVTACFMHLFGIAWLTIAALVAYYARSKGRSFTSWMIIAILASPLIAFLFAVVLPKNEQALALREGKKQCPECGEYVHKDARKCRHCSNQFSSLPAIPSQQQLT